MKAKSLSRVLVNGRIQIQIQVFTALLLPFSCLDTPALSQGKGDQRQGAQGSPSESAVALWVLESKVFFSPSHPHVL